MTLLEQTPPARTIPRAVPEPASGFDQSSGTVAVVLDFVGATLPQLDELLRTMRLRPEGPGRAGSLFQWSRGTQDGVRVTEVWQSHDYFESFFRAELRPRLAEAGLKEPEVTTYEVHSYLTQGPGVAQEAEDDGADGSGRL
jgi:hypothetical protein